MAKKRVRIGRNSTLRIAYLENASNPTRGRSAAGSKWQAVDSREGRESEESERDVFEHCEKKSGGERERNAEGTER